MVLLSCELPLAPFFSSFPKKDIEHFGVEIFSLYQQTGLPALYLKLIKTPRMVLNGQDRKNIKYKTITQMKNKESISYLQNRRRKGGSNKQNKTRKKIQ
jgi:hypothetical protein